MFRSFVAFRVLAVCPFAFPISAAAQDIDNVEERVPDADNVRKDGLDGGSAFPIEVDPLAGAQDEGAAGRFVLTAVDITGASAIAPEKFAPLYDDLLARYVTVEDVADLAEAITAMYRDKGYFLSRAVVPAQDPAGGVLRIRVVEGYVDEVGIDGDAPQWVRKRLEKTAQERPLRMASLERALSLIGDLSGVKVLSSKIEPDTDDLARHRLVVKISQDRLEAGFYADNRGTEDAGVLQTYLSVAANSLLQAGDQLSGGVFFTPEDPGELTLGQIAYAVPLGDDGAVLRASVMTSYFDAGGPREALETESRTKRLTMDITYPVIRRRRFTLWATAGFEGRNFEEERFGAIRFEDRIRAVHAGATLRKAHLDGVTSVSGEVVQGLDIFNASTEGALSRADATGEFTKITAEVARLQPLGANFSLYASASGQHAFDPLLSSQEFSLGGARYGRAYDYGELRGDDGFAANVEVRYGRRPGLDFLKAYQVYGYYDYGAVWNDNVAPLYDKLDLSSAGGGVRLTFSNDVRLNAEIAKPLDGAPYTQGDQSWRGFFNLSKSF